MVGFTHERQACVVQDRVSIGNISYHFYIILKYKK